jgi:hypothetical protein
MVQARWYFDTLCRSKNDGALYSTIWVVAADHQLTRDDIELIPLVLMKVIRAVSAFEDVYVADLKGVIQVNDMVSTPRLLFPSYG